MKKSTISLMLSLFLMLAGGAAAKGQSTTFSGYIRDYTGILLSDDHEYAILQDTLDLKIKHSRENVAFLANPYIYYYHDKEQVIDLRQSYMDIYLDSADIRIGKQQIVWGKADGVFITDVVSPKDLSEFLLPDFEEIRIGIQSLKADYYFGDNTVEFVWVPAFTPTTMPVEGSIWYVQPDIAESARFDLSKQEVPASLDNSEVFLRFSAITSAIDFELMTGYMWDDDPTLHVIRSKDASTDQLVLTVAPEHHRLSLIGGSFSTTLGGLVVRGEGAYYNGKYFRSEDPSLEDGVVEKDYLHYLIGLDYSIWDIRLSLQFVEKKIQEYDDLIINDENEDTVTFLVSRDFLRETLHLELFSYIGMNDNGSLLRPKMSYDLFDGFQILVGFNFFNGEKGSFGQYDANDMIYSKIKYSF